MAEVALPPVALPNMTEPAAIEESLTMEAPASPGATEEPSQTTPTTPSKATESSASEEPPSEPAAAAAASQDDAESDAAAAPETPKLASLPEIKQEDLLKSKVTPTLLKPDDLGESFTGFDFSTLNAKDLLAASVTKAPGMKDAGLQLNQKEDGIYVSSVGGAFNMFTEIKVGDRLLKIQDKFVEDMTMEDIDKILNEDKKIEVEVLKHRLQESTTSVMTDDLEIEKGDILRLQDLTATPELNGKTIKIIKESYKEGRYLVQVCNGEKMMVDMKNLCLPDDEEEVKEIVKEFETESAASS